MQGDRSQGAPNLRDSHWHLAHPCQIATLSSANAVAMLTLSQLATASRIPSARQPVVALVGLPLLFGLLDGAVLAGDYARLQLWPAFRAWPQMSFNLGALSAELGIMAVLLGGTVWWERLRRRKGYCPFAGEVAATALAGLGAFWLMIQLKG